MKIKQDFVRALRGCQLNLLLSENGGTRTLNKQVSAENGHVLVPFPLPNKESHKVMNRKKWTHNTKNAAEWCQWPALDATHTFVTSVANTRHWLATSPADNSGLTETLRFRSRQNRASSYEAMLT